MTNKETQALAIPEERGEWTLPDKATATVLLTAIREFQALCRAQMIEGHDYGIIPGTPKPTLLKPGAEKIVRLLGLADTYEIVERIEDWDKPLFSYTVRAMLTSLRYGVLVSTGLGSCNSMEAKYRWRDQKRKCPQCGQEAIIKGKEEYGGGWVCFKKKEGCGAKFKDGDAAIESQKVGRVLNEDIYDQVNTILKMGKKRALVDASLSAGRLSDVFTQDIEDTGPDVAPEAPDQAQAAAPGAPSAPPKERLATAAELKTLTEARLAANVTMGELAQAARDRGMPEAARLNSAHVEGLLAWLGSLEKP